MNTPTTTDSKPCRCSITNKSLPCHHRRSGPYTSTSVCLDILVGQAHMLNDTATWQAILVVLNMSCLKLKLKMLLKQHLMQVMSASQSIHIQHSVHPAKALQAAETKEVPSTSFGLERPAQAKTRLQIAMQQKACCRGSMPMTKPCMRKTKARMHNGIVQQLSKKACTPDNERETR